MSSDSFMILFDIIATVLGIYVIFRSIVMKKKKEIPVLFVGADDVKNCKDPEGFCNFLFPRALVFGIVCVVFGVVAFYLDGGLARFNVYVGESLATPSWGKTVNIILLVIFLASWFWFSFGIKKGKEKFFKARFL